MSNGIDARAIRRCETLGVRRVGRLGLFIALALSVALPGCSISDDDGDGTTKVNGSIHVTAGKPAEAVATVNGSIHVDANAAVTSATTVNGSVHLGDHATATSLNSVNGSITLGAGAHASGSVSSVNGELTLGDGAEVTDTLSNVNGKITLTAAHVAGGIKTVNGSMSITGASHVEGGILMRKSSGDLIQVVREIPRIVIGPGATVQGDLRFEHSVHLYVSDKATIGPVTGATPIPFTGDNPPN
jgi:acetyltransferase-like isoleucine patch superfamily enzyme